MRVLTFAPTDLALVGLAFGLSLGLTPLVRSCARSWGLVARPKSDRWHKKPTALYGGAAIFVSVLLPAMIFLPLTAETLAVVGASGILWCVGLVDDFWQIKPYQKLIGQVLGSALILASGLTLAWTPSPVINVAITIFWLIGITNAVNLLDNMDGLAAGVSAIAASALAISLIINGQNEDALLLAFFAASLLGFLVYNWNPASIFMGDCGSMFVGFFLASAALLHAPEGGGRSRSILAVLAVPVLILLIPIFDTTFVTVVRKLAGRSVSKGGRDHTSHRLVALGLSERRAVGMLYVFAALSGGLALLVRELPVDVSVAIIAIFTLILTLLGVHLAQVRVYESQRENQNGIDQPITAFLVNLSYKRRIFEVLLDVVLILLAYYVAGFMLFGPVKEGQPWSNLLQALPVILFVKLAIFLLVGVYRGLWRYVSLANLVVYARAVLLGSLASAFSVAAFQGITSLLTTIWVLDGILLLFLLAGSRLVFRLLRGLFPIQAEGQRRRVLIYGAGDGGELLLRELRNNPTLGCEPVGFADDDPMKAGRRIHGIPVLGNNINLFGICQEHRIDAVYLSSLRIEGERERQILNTCQALGIEVKRMRLVLEPVGTEEECPNEPPCPLPLG